MFAFFQYLLSPVSVYVTEIIFDKQNLEHITISITKKNMVVACSTQYNEFSQSERNVVQGASRQAINTYCFRSETMSLRSPNLIPCHVAECL